MCQFKIYLTHEKAVISLLLQIISPHYSNVIVHSITYQISCIIMWYNLHSQIAVSSSNVIKDDLVKNAFSHIVSCKAMMLLQNRNTMSFSVYVKEREWKEQCATRKYTWLQICLCICLCMTQLKNRNEWRSYNVLFWEQK